MNFNGPPPPLVTPDRRSARAGAKATGPKIDRLLWKRCPQCRRAAVYDCQRRLVCVCGGAA